MLFEKKRSGLSVKITGAGSSAADLENVNKDGKWRQGEEQAGGGRY